MFHPTENTVLRRRKEQKSSRTHYQVPNETQIRSYPKVIKTEKLDSEVEP